MATGGAPQVQKAPSMLQRLQRGTSFREVMEGVDAAVDELSIFLDPTAVGEVAEDAMLDAPTTVIPKEAAAAPADAGATPEPESSAVAAPAAAAPPRPPSTPLAVTDRLAFVLGAANLALTAFWVGRWPSHYHHFWLVKDSVLFVLRWWWYRRMAQHFMLLEYCYVANLAALAHIYFCPSNAFMRRAAFAIMSGPLMWSIIAMRNELTFHDVDKHTTLMMHASPAVCAWCMRWYPQAAWTAGKSAAQVAEWNHATWFQLAIAPVALNLLWVVGYYLTVFVVLDAHIKRRGYVNMFDYMITRPRARNSALSRLVLSAPPLLQPPLYLCIHTAAAALALLPTKLWFDYYWAHTAIVVAVLSVAAFNGSVTYLRPGGVRPTAVQRLATTERQKKGAAAAAKKAE